MELVVFFALKSLYPKISHQKASYLVELVDFSPDWRPCTFGIHFVVYIIERGKSLKL